MARGTVDIKTGIVDDNDIADVLGSCRVPAYGSDREVLHTVHKFFTRSQNWFITTPEANRKKTLR